MLGKTGDSAKGLTTLATLDLHSTVDMHSFVSTKIGKLRIAFVTNLASERFHTAVDVSVLL